jgi:hypothetical protein
VARTSLVRLAKSHLALGDRGAIVAGIEAGKDTVFAPRLPWEPLGLALRVLPLRIVPKITRPARGQ